MVFLWFSYVFQIFFNQTSGDFLTSTATPLLSAAFRRVADLEGAAKDLHGAGHETMDVGKPWENHGKMVVYGIQWDLHSGNLHIATEHGPVEIVTFPNEKR